MQKNISISNMGGSISNSNFAFNSKSNSVGPRSLNISVRKKENERIERENQAFAKRLFDNSGCISKKKFDQEYYNQTMYKNNLMKYNRNRARGMSSRRQLPPLQKSQDLLMQQQQQYNTDTKIGGGPIHENLIADGASIETPVLDLLEAAQPTHGTFYLNKV